MDFRVRHRGLTHTARHLAGLVLLALGLGGAPLPAGAGGLFDALDALGGQPQKPPEFLPPDEAFIFSTDEAPGEARLNWVIAPGYYLYRDKMTAVAAGEGLDVGAPRLPGGKIKADPYFGDVEIYTGVVDVGVPVAGNAPAELIVGYQGCAEDGICYPPIKKTMVLGPTALSGAAAPAMPAVPLRSTGAAPVDAISERLASGAPWLTLLAFFGFGLALSLTPCVYPMVPILSGIIVGQGASVTLRKSLVLSGVYVVAMALAYALAGVAAGLFGVNLQAAFQHPAVIAAFSAVFVLLALAMFGLFQLRLPVGLQNRLEGLSRARQGGSLTGVALMGLLSAIIVGPCVAPPLAGALAYIGARGNPVLGGGALFAMGLGMGTPLLLVGASAGSLLPRAGAWMQRVQRVFGVVFLGVAIWFLERIVPGALALALWGLLLIGAAIYAGALDRLPAEAGGGRRLGKAAGIAMLVYGATALVGAAGGGEDLFRPLAHYQGGKPEETALDFTRARTLAELDAELIRASSAGRSVMVDFYADWCVECKHLEKRTFRDARVRAALSDVTLVQIDVTANSSADQEILDRYGLYGPPAIVFHGPDRAERRDLRIIGFKSPADFLTHIEPLAAL
ncbi:MAG: protein-disulfide reductase DsbD [Gammaproteobacteria bacterium]|nr:protein-disulfide reductase DsbD [Gammaproteobacteria bacterium]